MLTRLRPIRPDGELALTDSGGVFVDPMTRQTVGSRLAAVKDHSTLRLTTSGRKSGKRHTVTVWFVVDGKMLYLCTLKLNRDWPRNIMKNGKIELDIGGTVFKGHAKQIIGTKAMERVKALLNQKYWAAWFGSWFGMGPEGAFAVTIDA